jgi:hypothetical protein
MAVNAKRTTVYIGTSIQMMRLDTGKRIHTFIATNTFDTFITVLGLHHN